MTPVPATTMRRLALGDTWRYAAEGSLTPLEGSVLPVRGTITVSIVPDALLGRDDALGLKFDQQLGVTQPDGGTAPLPAPAWMFTFVQDAASGDVSIAADNMSPDGRARVAEVPQVFYPGTWSERTGYANRLEFGGGEFVANTLVTRGAEWVDVPLGRFAAWACTIGSESPMTGRIEGRDWWTPELGAPIRFEVNSPLPDGARLMFTAGLSATSVPVGGAA